MLTGLDHVIIGVHDLYEAWQAFQQLGLAVSGGGNHPSGGTANRIIVIEETYLELIAVREPAEAQQSMLDRLALGEGLLNFVLASNDMQADSQAIRERGIAVLGPDAGELRVGDGRSRGWSRTNVERPDLTQHYPFLIQHDSSGDERRFRLAGWQTPPLHPLGVSKVLSVTLAVDDLGEATQRFQRIYGLDPSPTFTGEPDGWEAMLTAFRLGDSGQSFELAVPLPFAGEAQDEAIDLLTEPGALARHLSLYGESLCRVTLGVRDLAASRRFLDEHSITYTYRDEPRACLWIHPQQACGATLLLYEHDPERVISAGGQPEE